MYETRPVEVGPESIAACARLLSEVFPGTRQFTPEYLDWQYRHNPAGSVVGFNAYAGETLAAHYVTLPVRARWRGASVKGLLSLNTATHPAHQGKKLFTTLAEATYAHGAAQGYAFVIGVANANSTPGFIKKLGFQLVAPLEARLGVGPLPGRDAGFQPEYESHWDAELLRWRLANPARPYTVHPVGSGCRVQAPTGRYGIEAVLAELSDVRGVQPRARGARVLNPVRLWLGIDPSRRWARSLYRPLPERLRPSPLNLIFRDLGSGGATLDARALRFQALDFDAY